MQVCYNEKLRMDICYTDPGGSALRKGGMVLQSEKGESKTSIGPGIGGLASFTTIQIPSLKHVYKGREQCRVRHDSRISRRLPNSLPTHAYPSPSSNASQERIKHRCDDVRSEVADALVEGATQSRRVVAGLACRSAIPSATAVGPVGAAHARVLTAIAALLQV